jgi:hypothetical protein
MYFHTRDTLWSINNQTVYKHNSNLPGKYYNNTEPFFVDVVFNADADTILESLDWITEVLDSTGKENEFITFSHISVWNSQQHSGRIAVSQVFNNLQYDTSRRSRGVWNFNDFRDIVKARGMQFILNLFDDYQAINTSLNPDKPWYEKELMQDKYHVVRFEFDNLNGQTLLVHNVHANTLKSDR